MATEKERYREPFTVHLSVRLKCLMEKAAERKDISCSEYIRRLIEADNKPR